MILDAKRSDIGSSVEGYAEAYFGEGPPEGRCHYGEPVPWGRRVEPIVRVSGIARLRSFRALPYFKPRGTWDSGSLLGRWPTDMGRRARCRSETQPRSQARLSWAGYGCDAYRSIGALRPAQWPNTRTRIRASRSDGRQLRQALPHGHRPDLGKLLPLSSPSWTNKFCRLGIWSR